MLRRNLVPGWITILYLAIAAFDIYCGLTAKWGWLGVLDTFGAAMFLLSARFNARGNYYRRRTKHWQRLIDDAYARMVQRWRDEQGL